MQAHLKKDMCIKKSQAFKLKSYEQARVTYILQAQLVKALVRSRSWVVAKIHVKLAVLCTFHGRNVFWSQVPMPAHGSLGAGKIKHFQVALDRVPPLNMKLVRASRIIATVAGQWLDQRAGHFPM